jgi:malonate transporter and related proteins
MGHVLAVTGPIYLALAVGYLAVRFGAFTKADMRVLGKFVLNFALPAMLFTALVSRPLADTVRPGFVFAFGLGSLLVMCGAVGFARVVLKQKWNFAGICAMGTACPNSGFVGFPIVLVALGPMASAAVAQCFLVENLLLLPVAFAIADRPENGHAGISQAVWHSMRLLARNPIVIAIVSGVACAAFGFTLPAAAVKVVGLYASASAGLSLFVIGGSLAGLQLRGMRTRVTAITVSKLFIHPLLVFAVAAVMPFPISNELRAALVLFAAMPMMGIFPIVAQKHGYDELASACVLAATIGSFFTVSVLLWWLHHIGWITQT